MHPKIGDTVHVPSSKAGIGVNYPSAMVSGEIQAIQNAKIIITLPNGNLSHPIYIKLARRKLCFLIVQIGDFQTEQTLLVPLRKSILQYTRLILTDDYIKCVSIRSIDEFIYYWHKNHALISHLVLIGHGRPDAILFGENNWIPALDFRSKLSVDGPIGEAKQIISLCCKTGGGNFGKPVSAAQICEIFLGPSGNIHASSASLFYQSYLAYHLVNGYTSDRAYDYARIANPGAVEFNLWKERKLRDKKRKKELLG